MKNFLLKSGLELPWIGFGTDGFHATAEIKNAFHFAINNGYRLIDIATIYNSYSTITSIIKGTPKESLILCVKFNRMDLEKITLQQLFDKVSHDFGRDCIDIFMMHNTKVGNHKSILSDLLDLKKDRKIKSIGVSNFSLKHFSAIEKYIEHIDINQIEFHPFLFQRNLYDFCRKNYIHIMGYRPLGNGQILQELEIQKIAAKYKDRTTSQILINWCNEMQVSSIVKSKKTDHLLENFQALNFCLEKEDKLFLSNINKMKRTCFGEWSDF